MFFQATALTSDIQTNAETFFKITDLGQLGTKGIQAGIAIGGALALAYAVWGAIDWIGSEGDKQKLENAKNKITHAILGLAILACVWTIWALAQYFLGLRAGSGSGYYGGGNGSTCDPEDQAQCKVVCQTNKGCTGSNCVPGKDEYNVPDCECAPGPGQRWVKVDNNPWGRCE